MFEDVDHDGGGKGDEANGGEGADQHAGDGALGGEGFPEDREDEGGEVGTGGDGKGEADHVGDVLLFEQHAEHDGNDAEDDGCNAGDLELLGFAGFTVLDDVDPEVVGEGGGAGEGKAGDDGKDSGEGYGGDEAKEGVSAEGAGEEWGGHVAAGIVLGDGLLANKGEGAESEDKGEEVEEADEGGGVAYGGAGGLRVGDGEEAHEDVGKAGGAEHEGKREGEGVPGVGNEGAGGEDVEGGVGFAGLVGGGAEEREGVEVKLGKHEDAHQQGAAKEEDGLGDLHPRGGDHAAKEDVGEHDDADDDDGDMVGEAEEELDEKSGADHLGDEVEDYDGEGADGGSGADGALAKAKGDDVCEGVLAEVAQRFGDEEHDNGPAHEEADGVDESVEALERDHANDAEEAGGAHVVAGEGEAVLQAGDAATGGVEGGGGLGAPRRIPGDGEGDDGEKNEEENGGKVYGAEGRGGGGGCLRKQREHQDCSPRRRFMAGSYTRLAHWT